MKAVSKITLAAVLLLFVWTASTPRTPAQTWKLTSAPITNWTSVACSADGTKIAATCLGDTVYLSGDSGATWTPSGAPAGNWLQIASSADGHKLVAISTWPGWGGIYASTNGGVSWSLTSATTGDGESVASSADGTVLIAAGSYATLGGPIIMSFDSGANWALSGGDTSPYGPWHSVACSADGKVIMIAGYAVHVGLVCALGVSVDSGKTWWQADVPAAGWRAVACSSDGYQMVAASEVAYDGNKICVSGDGGLSWAVTGAPDALWNTIAPSADGRKLIAAAGGYEPGPIYTSADFGATWVSNDVATAHWAGLASSADGCSLVAVVKGGGIYTLRSTPSPVLNVSASSAGFLLSWIVPSQPFILQESSDLKTWSAVGVTALLNYTNLHYEVSVPGSADPRFFRLASP